MRENESFHLEVKRILNELYNNPIEQVKHITKRIVIETEYRYIEYLESIGLIKQLKNVSGGGSFGIQLENKGYEVFENYNGWDDYRKKVLVKANKIEKAKNLAARFWWLPIAISIVALTFSIISYFKT